MANRETVTLRFTNPPTAAQSTLITRRIREEDVPNGADGASTALGDYDFPGFDIGKADGHPCLEKASWRSPNLRIEKFQAIMHLLGFPNEASSYPSWTIEEEDFYEPALQESSLAELSQAEMQMVQLLFPEFHLNLKGTEAPALRPCWHPIRR